MKTDNNFVYLSCGIRLAKFSMPEMSSVYVIETEHSNGIIDFTLSPSNIITTSADNTVKVHTIETGEQCMNSLDELECDHLQACGDYLLTRINQGSSILVFRYYQGNFDLDFIDEINLEDVKLALGEVLEFKMQGNIFTSFTPNSTHYDLVLLVSVTSEGILVNALKHKPLSEL